MAEILISGIRVDTENIDLLVQYCPLATLEGTVRFDRELLKTMPPNDSQRSYWEHRLETHLIALDIAEKIYEDGIKVVQRILNVKPAYELTAAIINEAKKPQTRSLGIEE